MLKAKAWALTGKHTHVTLNKSWCVEHVNLILETIMDSGGAASRISTCMYLRATKRGSFHKYVGGKLASGTGLCTDQSGNTSAYKGFPMFVGHEKVGWHKLPTGHWAIQKPNKDGSELSPCRATQTHARAQVCTPCSVPHLCQTI